MEGERPDFLIFIFAIIMIVSTTAWAQQGGFSRLVEKGQGGSLVTMFQIPQVNFDLNNQQLSSGNNSITPDITHGPVGDQYIALGEGRYAKSVNYQKVRITRGNTGNDTQPNDEYIILNADLSSSQAPIDITGWTLRNGKDLKLVKVSGDLVRYKPVTATIPQGVRVFNKNGEGPKEDIYLKSGERAIITTGRFSSLDEIPVKYSFKTNRCTGYLESLQYYNFQPSLPQECPNPADELSSFNSLEEDCYQYLRGLPRCFTPEFLDVYRTNDDEYRDVIKGAPLTLSSNCKNILRENFSYQTCLDIHADESNFEGREWRVFLGQPFSMYDPSREVITLFDRAGKVVDQISY